MNIHHLELFYYVAKHRGISEAVRHMPYGIQQPAISSQILQLEADLGRPLFQRRPFQLTATGEELFAFVRPFFEQLPELGDKLRGGATRLLRIAASAIILRDHLPPLLNGLRKKFPALTITLHDASQIEMEGMFSRQEIDLGITVLEGKPAAGLRSQKLIDLPLMLLVPADSKLQSTDELWQRDRLAEPLVSLPASEPITRHFRRGLARRKIDWPVGIEVHALDVIPAYVANGLGLGVTVALASTSLPRGVRAIPFTGWPPVTIGALWAGKPGTIIETLLHAMQTRVKEALG